VEWRQQGPVSADLLAGRNSMRRAAVVLLLALASLVPAPTASADEVVVVPGTSFPAGNTYLSWFGCAGLFGPAPAGPSSTVGVDPQAPLGGRATRLDMSGAGHAAGPVTQVDRVAGATWSMWVRPAAGGQGVAHVWYVSAELGAGEVWSGRADLTAAAGRWQQVRPAGAGFTWTRTVAATGEVLEQAGSATLAGFTQAHGDGPGYLMAGFGCDAAPFTLDAVAAGDPGTVTTYDLEGFPVTTTIAASRAAVAPGAEVTVRGVTLDGGQQATGAPLVLESKPRGAAGFAPVGPAPSAPGPGGRVEMTVSPDTTTAYRWFQPATGYADAGWSPRTVVRVGR
jgi:hypothetical protein